jgi:hypothetical protein
MACNPPEPRTCRPIIRRVGRCAHRASAIASLLIAFAMALGWWWSRGRSDGLQYWAPDSCGARSFLDVQLLDGRIMILHGFDFDAAYRVEGLPPPGFRRYVTKPASADNLDEWWRAVAFESHALGFGFAAEWDGQHNDANAIMVPAWFIIFIASLLPAHWLVTRHRARSRLLKSACPNCRYDLRGAPQHGCPECGWNRQP